MQTEAGPLSVLFPTDGAAERFDPGVHPQVVVQVGLLREGFSTEGADERSEVIVNHHVLVQVALHSEALLTHRTLEGPLPGVHAHVAHQVEVRGKCFGADSALKSFQRPLVSLGLGEHAPQGILGCHCS